MTIKKAGLIDQLFCIFSRLWAHIRFFGLLQAVI